MMTIKVIQHKVSGTITHLYECERIYYNSVDFGNREEFLEKYKKITEGIGNASIIGIPDEYWGDKKIEPNMLICIYYGCNDKTEHCLVLQNSTVYVMQGGQTVDKIHC